MKCVLIPALLILPQTVMGQDNATGPENMDVSYTYAEIRYIDLDAPGSDGIGVGGSYRINEEWFVLGEISDLDFNSNFDQSIYEFGGGYIYDLDNGYDLVATASIVSVDSDFPILDDDDTGFALSGGVRGFVAPKVEIRGFVNHINLDNNDTFLEIGGDFFFSPRFSAGGTLEFAGDRDLISAGVRFHF